MRQKLYPTLKPSKPAIFKKGDSVRLNRLKSVFEKGYTPSWTWEVLFVNAINDTNPTTYRIVDYTNKEIKGSFYAEELQLVDKSDNIYPIEKIIRRKTKDGELYYLVKFLGYPDEANSWVKHSDLHDAI